MNKQDHINSALETLNTHVFTKLVSNQDIVAWRCKRPNSSCYAFDILITHYGISVVGDIDNLTFRVGSSYGMEFLAGRDVEYYIHSKLDHHCKERDLNHDRVREFCLMHWLEPIREAIVDNLDYEQQEAFKEALKKYGFKDESDFMWLDDENQIRNLSSLDLLIGIASCISNDFDELAAEIEDEETGHTPINLADLIAALRNISDSSTEEEFCHYLADSDTPEGYMELSDWTFTKPSEFLISRLYLVNQAAQKIMKQIKDAEEQAHKEGIHA